MFNAKLRNYVSNEIVNKYQFAFEESSETSTFNKQLVNSIDEEIYTSTFGDKIPFNYGIFKRILNDLYTYPCKVTQLGYVDIEDIIELSDNLILLKQDIVIIYYYGEIRLIGFNHITDRFEIFNIPSKFEHILSKLDCFCFNESTIKTLLDSQFEAIDFYYSQDGYRFEPNGHLMYYIYPY